MQPNIVFELREEYAGEDGLIPNCASATATADGLEDTAQQVECPEIELIVPPVGDEGNLLDKVWDTPAVGERTGHQGWLSLSWSTGGRSNLDSVVISDVPEPSAATLADSVFDAFDLLRVEAITADPLLTYDQVEAVEIYSLDAGAWVQAANDPCPEACDGTFPGVSLTAAERADTIAVRLVFVESPTRGERHGDDPTAPTVGSGVARSFANDRPIDLTFYVRDELRSDPQVPVLASQVYNVPGEPGEVDNVARAEGFTDGELVVRDNDSDIILITEVPLQVDALKTWSGGPLGAPPPGSDADNYPTARLTLTAVNQTPREIDRLTLTDPVGGTNPFDTFDVIDIRAITPPGNIGATSVAIILTLADGTELTLTREEALAAGADQLADVVGLEVVYTGRIHSEARPQVVLDTRLRAESRETGEPIVPPAAPETLTVDNELSVLGEDLIDYDGVDPVTHDDDAAASIDITAPGINLQVTKTFTPDSQVEPDDSPVTVRLTGQPQGPSRANSMEVVDLDASFWNQYDFVGLAPFPLVGPINEVRVDVFTGSDFVVVDGDAVIEGGDWVIGTTGAQAVLPDVPVEDVQGLRFTTDAVSRLGLRVRCDITATMCCQALFTHPNR